MIDKQTEVSTGLGCRVEGRKFLTREVALHCVGVQHSAGAGRAPERRLVRIDHGREEARYARQNVHTPQIDQRHPQIRRKQHLCRMGQSAKTCARSCAKGLGMEVRSAGQTA